MHCKITEEQQKLLEFGSHLKIRNKETDEMEEWYYLPFWFKRIDKEGFEYMFPEKLPENVKKWIEDERNPS